MADPSPTDLQSLFAAAVAAHQAGRFEQAGALYRRLVVWLPAQAQALDHFGVLLAAQDAVAGGHLLDRAVRVSPQAAQSWCNLGVVRKEQAEPQEAERCFQRALALRPDLGAAVNNLAALLKENGRPRRSAGSGRRCGYSRIIPTSIAISARPCCVWALTKKAGASMNGVCIPPR